MLRSVQNYNALNGVIYRDEIELLISALDNDEQHHLSKKLSNTLDQNKDVEKFDIDIVNKGFETPPASLLGCLECVTDPKEEFTGLNKAVSADSIYQMVTDKILAQLKASVDFKQTWNGGDKEGYMYAYNFITKKNYTSINQVLLGAATNPNTGDFELLKNPYYLTFKQVEKLKGKVVKGAKAHQVIYYTTLYKYEQAEPKLNFGTYDKDRFIAWAKKNSSKIEVLNKSFTDMNGNESSIDMDSFVYQCIYPILKYYNVFSGSDITGIDFKLDEFTGVGFIEKTGQINDLLPTAEAIIENYPEPAPTLVLGGDVASYNRMKDTVNMPRIKFFDNSQAYYTAMFHEYIHSTGSEERLERKKGKKFADKDYAFEELVAEIGASFLSANAGILHYTLRNGAAYIKGWHENLIVLLEEDNRFIFKAATLAQKAANFILQHDENGVPKYLKDFDNKPTKNKNSLLEQQIPVKELTDDQIKSVLKEYASDILFTDEINKYVDKVKAEFNLRKTDNTAVNFGVPTGVIKTHADWLKMIKPLKDGTATLDYYKAAFNKTIESKDVLKADISKTHTIADFRKIFFKKDKKEDYVNSFYTNLLTFFTYGGITMSFTQTYESVITKIVEKADQAYLDELMRLLVEETNARKERNEKIKKSIKNPESLEEYLTYIKVKGLKSLNADQLADFDKLYTEDYIKKEDQNIVRIAERKVTSASTAEISDVNLEYNESTHTKTGDIIHVVSKVDRVEKEVYYKLKALARNFGGYYSSWNKGGAIAGFIFKEKEQADDFINSTANGSKPVEPKDLLKVNASKRKKALNKLIESSKERIVKAYENINQDRKTNTARRQRLSNGVIEDQETIIRTNKMLIALAESLLNGSAIALRNISELTEVQEIESVFRAAVRKWMRNDKKENKTYSESPTISEVIKNDVEFFDIAFLLELPVLKVYKDHVKEIITATENKKGFKLMAKRLYKAVVPVKEQEHMVYIKPRFIDDYEKLLKASDRYGSSSTLTESLKSYKRLVNGMGLSNTVVLRQAAREAFSAYKSTDVYNSDEKKAKNLKKLLNKVQLQKIDGFFPTPDKLIDTMLDNLSIDENDTILEPSAGIGSIADKIKDQYPDNDLTVVEYAAELAKILTEKGYDTVHQDFLKYKGKHDVIIMNPPFEKDQDIDHVLHAFSLLNSGGQIAAVMANNKERSSIKKRKKFNDFVSEYGWSEANPVGSFKNGFKQTGVNTITVYLQKEETPEPKKTTPKVESVKVDQDGQTALFGSFQLTENVKAECQTETTTQQQPTVTPTPKKSIKDKPKNPLVKNLSATKVSAQNIERYAINGDIAEFLGNLEIKPKDSLAITLDAEQGAGKTRFLFQLLNEFAGSGYKCLFVSLEEHPESSLFNDKVKEYINPANEHLIDAIGELPNWYADLKELIPHYDCIFIDSWNKIAEEDRTVDFDKHLRKGFDSKLFVSIFQRTTDGKMRGGSKAAFDGDVILKMEKDPDYRNSFVYANKNRYQNKPLDSLKYNIFTKSLVRENNNPTPTIETSGYVVVD